MILDAQISLDFSGSLNFERKIDMHPYLVVGIVRSSDRVRNYSEPATAEFPISPWVQQQVPPHATQKFPSRNIVKRAAKCKWEKKLKTEYFKIQARIKRDNPQTYEGYDGLARPVSQELAQNHIDDFVTFCHREVFKFLAEWSNVLNANPQTDLMHWAHDIPQEIARLLAPPK